ncbi:KTSC domain-containing protein [Cytophaga sp. FL35]|uniref:KTSC domain-containing protein n=1 Tax=Cytophaga sp. FL35 TaxID=1904456 RepID=UPI00165380B4|nr:KTSC domain-containing protein [Cytophaga sp. FL35]MBC6998341.1 KTSC domain-containing protein [Cytophaga sp. FL35]
MEMIPVSSSNIKAIGYDEENAVLRIEFNKGGIYEYYDVPQYEFDGLYAADSKGSYANQNIYKNYRQQKIG